MSWFFSGPDSREHIQDRGFRWESWGAKGLHIFQGGMAMGLSMAMGVPQVRWRVYFMENPHRKWMMTGGTTWLRKPSIWIALAPSCSLVLPLDDIIESWTAGECITAILRGQRFVSKILCSSFNLLIPSYSQESVLDQWFKYFRYVYISLIPSFVVNFLCLSWITKVYTVKPNAFGVYGLPFFVVSVMTLRST